MRKGKLFFGFLLSIFGFGLFSSFSSADTTGYIDMPLNNNGFSACVSNMVINGKQGTILLGVKGFGTNAFLYDGDNILLYSGSFSNLLSTGTIDYYGAGSDPFLVYFDTGYEIDENINYIISWLSTGSRSALPGYNPGLAMQLGNGYTLVSSRYATSCTWNLNPFAASTSMRSLVVGALLVSTPDEEICEIEVDYGDTFFSTGTVYITGADFIRSGQVITYDPGDTFDGVDIHWTSALNGGTWVDHYDKTDLYLLGLYDKFYTGGLDNFWVLNPIYGVVNFSGYELTGLDVSITAIDSYSGNAYRDFYLNLSHVLVSNYNYLIIIVIILFGLVFLNNLFIRKR